MALKLTGWSATGLIKRRLPILPITSPITYHTAVGGLTLQTELHTAKYYTVQFELQMPVPGVSVVSFGLKSIAEVIWSVKGNSVRRVLTVYNGTAISGTGEHVTVKLKDDSEAGTSPSAREYPATINLAEGTRPSAQIPTFFSRQIVNGEYPPYTIVPAGTVIFSYPANTGANSLMIAYEQFPTGTNAAMLANDLVMTSLLGGLNTLSYAITSGPPQFMPIAPGTTHILINNNSAVTYRVTPIWGIEG